MRSFDLKAALAGEAVCTRDGKPVTQLAYFNVLDYRPVVGAVLGGMAFWREDGQYTPLGDSPYDLVMANVKKTGWVARFKNESGEGCYSSGQIYDTKEAAQESEPQAASYHEIDWEE
jgi:hypothetical protein